MDNRPLWPHQTNAIEFAMSHPAAMLPIPMGGGKSRVAIEVIERDRAQRVLILCKKNAVLGVWPEQFNLYSPRPWLICPLRDQASVKKKAEEAARYVAMQQQTKRPLAMIVNYHSAWYEPMGTWLRQQKWDAVIMDESHTIKAPAGKISRYVARLASPIPRKLALTGTPFHHAPQDIFGQYRALNPTIYGTSYTLFRGRYFETNPFFHNAIVHVAGSRPRDCGVCAHTIDRTPAFIENFHKLAWQGKVDIVLPEPQHITLTHQLGPKGWRVYKELENDYYSRVDAGEITAANAMVKGMRLQQATSGFGSAVSVDGETGVETRNKVVLDGSKEELLTEILDGIGQEPVVIFSYFRYDINAIKVVCDKLGLSCGELSGHADDVAAWKNGEYQVLVAQIRSGDSVDLTRSRYCIYYSVGRISLGDFDQSMSRVQRPGQTRNVTYYYLGAKGTIDEVVFAARNERREINQAVLNWRPGKSPQDSLAAAFFG